MHTLFDDGDDPENVLLAQGCAVGGGGKQARCGQFSTLPTMGGTHVATAHFVGEAFHVRRAEHGCGGRHAVKEKVGVTRDQETKHIMDWTRGRGFWYIGNEHEKYVSSTLFSNIISNDGIGIVTIARISFTFAQGLPFARLREDIDESVGIPSE